MIFKKKVGLKIIIVGLPRSGTSFLTSLVQELTDYNVGDNKELKSADENNKYGYFEFIKLMSISDDILKQQGGDFHNIPSFEKGWIKKFKKQKKDIKRIVRKNNLELYKDNKVLCLADFYKDIFPKAKWIFIERNVNDTFKSRFGSYIDFDNWVTITEKRLECWCQSKVCKEALSLSYEEFFIDFPKIIEKIVDHLEIDISQDKKEECYGLFKPSKK